MTNLNRLLVVLDQIFGFPNRQSSKVKNLRQGYDNQTDDLYQPHLRVWRPLFWGGAGLHIAHDRLNPAVGAAPTAATQ